MKNPRASRLALLLTILAATGCSHSKSNSPGTGSQITVTIRPQTVSLGPGETVSFSVTVVGPSNAVVLWSVMEGAGGGTVSKDGLYTAPPTLGTFHVVAMATGQNYTAGYAAAEVNVTDKKAGSKDGGPSASPSDASPTTSPKDASPSNPDDAGAVLPKDATTVNPPKDATPVNPKDATPVNPKDGNSSMGGPHVSRDPNGWTVVTPSADTRIIHVSSSTGNDSGDGSEAAPLKTIAAAVRQLRRNWPDWMLLKAGDTWNESFGVFGGRSADEPQVISSYGSGPRPRIVPVGDTAFSAAPHLYLMGVEFYDPAKDPSSPSFVDGAKSPEGIRWVVAVGSVEDFLLEDCALRFLNGAFTFVGPNKIQIRRNLISDMYTNDGHTGGGYYKDVADLVIEENIFDHNGWIRDPKVTPNGFNVPTVFNHDIYLEGKFSHAVIRGNIFMRVSSLAVAVVNYSSEPNYSTDALIENNFFFEGEMGLSVAYGPQNGKMTAVGSSFTAFTIQNNVFLQINRDNPTQRALGSGMSVKSLAGGVIKGNIFSDFSYTPDTLAISLGSDDETNISSDITVEGNIAYRIRDQAIVVVPRAGWKDVKVINNEIQDPDLGAAMITQRGPSTGVSYSGNIYSGTKPGNFALVASTANGNAGPVNYDQWVSQSGETGSQVKTIDYPEPGRTLESYLTSKALGGLPQFFSAVRGRSKANWNPAYTAAEINNYIRAGFGRKAL